jgi:hypothetical protein
MKSYLIISGIIFGLHAVMHFVRTIENWHLLAADPLFVLGTAAEAAITGTLTWWAWKLLLSLSSKGTSHKD